MKSQSHLIVAALIVLGVAPTQAQQVFRCGEPRGMAMVSDDGHKVQPDGFTNVKPVVTIDKNVMTVVWGDAKSAGGTEKVWKAAVVHRSPESVSAVAQDTGPAGSAVMLYTMNIKRRFLYVSSHKESRLINGSLATAYVAECGK